jgi:tetratricopeptide (TPR) repeat protein
MHPDYSDLLYFRAAALFQGGDAAAAGEVLQRALERNPRFARARRLLSLCLVALKRDQEALAQFRQSLGESREAPRAWMDVAWVALRQGDPERAVKDLERLRSRLPEYPDLHYGLGVAHLAAGRGEEAEAAFARALELAPDYALARFRLGQAKLGRGAPAEALCDLERAARALPDYADVWLALAEARRLGGDAPGALAAAERALEVNPGFSDARAERATLLGACGRELEAAREWKAVLRLDPLHPIARAHAGGLGEEAMEEGYAG